ncbi:hypothetical protein [Micromonospora craniellae]|uniref:Uncharacterized protein n=1 Tax=Micromonospora craniellae TaxID=2294034 RepID=A0A372FSY9_9ACTN|nr:hypothetical protein [Micromonospora craniellae]QOC94372.1 hypothetical protein ID554_12735 [Micromonospora craniellae]RFS43744.1 hypothetical protein D0Q02_26070 [Micromonospora craniellae]
MSTPTLIGVAAFRGAYTARYLQFGEEPEKLIPLLRRIWTDTFGRDTDAMATALLAHHWWTLTATPKPRRWYRQPPVPGLGYPADTDADPRKGSLREPVAGALEWLYLLHLDQRRLVVYEATIHSRWLRHSAHHLDPAEDLFVTAPALDDGGAEMTVCTACGAVDEIDHITVPSMAGYGHDTVTCCTRCGSSVATDPMFGDHVTRKPWPPHHPTPDNTR